MPFACICMRAFLVEGGSNSESIKINGYTKRRTYQSNQYVLGGFFLALLITLEQCYLFSHAFILLVLHFIHEDKNNSLASTQRLIFHLRFISGHREPSFTFGSLLSPLHFVQSVFVLQTSLSHLIPAITWRQ